MNEENVLNDDIKEQILNIFANGKFILIGKVKEGEISIFSNGYNEECLGLTETAKLFFRTKVIRDFDTVKEKRFAIEETIANL